MKKLIFVPVLFFSILLVPQTKQDTTWKVRINKIENELTNISKQNTEAEIENLKDKLEFQQKLIEQTSNSVSNQLNAASYSLTIFEILFAIAAIGLGFYVTYIERKIVKIGEENKELLAKNQKIKEDIEAVNNLIQSDIHNLFVKIKREETDYILDRLVKAPKEIRDAGYTLLSRELQSENFSKLRQAYLNSDQSDLNDEYYWEKLFIRHFLLQTLKDEQLRKKFSAYIGHIFSSALKNEIIKCTSDLATALVDKGILEFKLEINYFFGGLTNSKNKDYQDIIQLLFDKLISRKNRFDTFTVVESVINKRFAKIAFGNLLLDKYSTDNPTEPESLVFIELADLIAAQQKDDEKARLKLETS